MKRLKNLEIPKGIVIDEDFIVEAIEDKLKKIERERTLERLRKPKAIPLGFSNHDCETHYKCPVCNVHFGSWTLFGQPLNQNKTRDYCPNCKTELDGLK